jgi:hypothetical protein
MNKKTGQIISAVVIGLAVLWLSQKTIFAQEPVTFTGTSGAITGSNGSYTLTSPDTDGCVTFSIAEGKMYTSMVFSFTNATREILKTGFTGPAHTDFMSPGWFTTQQTVTSNWNWYPGNYTLCFHPDGGSTNLNISILGYGTPTLPTVPASTGTRLTFSHITGAMQDYSSVSDGVTRTGIWGVQGLNNAGRLWFTNTVTATELSFVFAPNKNDSGTDIGEFYLGNTHILHAASNMSVITATGNFTPGLVYVDVNPQSNTFFRYAKMYSNAESPGGGGDCATVADAHFDAPVAFDAGGWNTGWGVTIHDSYIDIPATVDTWKVFSPTQKIYTATIYARSATTQTTTAMVAITNKEFSGEMVTIPIEETVNDEFTKYTFALNNTLTPGTPAYLYIVGGVGGLQIDYFCLERESGVCDNPAEINYIYSDNPWDDQLSDWTPFEINSAFNVPVYTKFPVIVEIDGYSGGYQKSYIDNGWDFLKIFTYMKKLLSFTDESISELEGVYQGDKLVDTFAFVSPKKALLESIDVDYAVNYMAVKSTSIIVFADVNDEWVEVGSYTDKSVSNPGGVFAPRTATIPLDAVRTPTNYMVSVIHSLKNIGLFLPLSYITKISTYGCFSGMAYSSTCIVSDPNLDTGINGGPDDYYWYWSPTAPVISGSVTLAADNQSELSQNVYAEAPGRYQLTINMDSATADSCQLLASGMDTDRTSRFFSVSMPCQPGIISQTLTAQVDLPAEPFKFILTSGRGVNVINSVCFGVPGAGCINPNSDFSAGLAGYSGGEMVAGGGVLLSPGKALQGIGVPYPAFTTNPGPFILTVGATIFTNTNVSTGSIPVYVLPPTAIAATPGISDTHTTISGTTTFSYTIATHPQNDYGPAVWNWDDPAGQSLRVTSYCITTGTNKLWYGDKSCTTVTNPDFLEGLNGWTNSAVYDAGSWVKFASGGYVQQTIGIDNLITNPGFEVNTTGWDLGNPTYMSLSRDTTQSKSGSASAKITETGNTSGAWVYYAYSGAQAGITYTFGMWVKKTGLYKLNIYTPDATMFSSAQFTGAGEWEFRTVTASPSSTSGVLYVFLSDQETTANDWYIDGAVLVAGNSIPVPYTTPQSTTLHIIGRAPDNLPTNATATISSTAGIFTATHTFGNSFIPDEFFDKFNVGGDVQITVTGDPLFELDYVCLLGGDYDGPGDDGEGPDGGPDDIGAWSEVCGAPPMLIITNTLSSWMPSIWPTLTAPDNLTTLTAYTAMNVRYIACFITGWAQLGMYKTDQIIALLRQIKDQLLVGNLLSLLGIVVMIISLLLGSTGEIIETIGAMADLLSTGGSIASLLLIIPAIIALVVLIIMLVKVLMAVGPIFFSTFSAAMIGTDGVTLIPDTANQQVLGYIIAGLQLFDQAAGQTYMMPFVALIIAIGTIGLFIWTINKISAWTT